MVFMIGGGNYAEFQNLQDWAKKSPAPNQRTVGNNNNHYHAVHPCIISCSCCSLCCYTIIIAYGCTELQSPDDFLAQLTALGRGELTTPPKPSSNATSSSHQGEIVRAH